MTLEVPLWMQNGQFPSYSDRTLISTLLSPGIPEQPPQSAQSTIPPTTSDLAVTLASTTPPVCNVAAGTVVIAGTDQTRQGNYLCRSTAQQTVNLDARPASGSRIDLVFAKVIDTSAGVTGTDGWIIDKLSGQSAASNPSPPSQPTSSERLAQVLVPSGAGAITITDLRKRALSGVFPPMGLQAWGVNPGSLDTTSANSPVRHLTLNATVPPGTYKVSARAQSTTITAVPIWINALLAGTGVPAANYIYAYNTIGTSLGNVWPGTTFIIATFSVVTACSWFVTTAVGGNGATRTSPNNVYILVERIG
jgi:hypothetical protein